MNNIQDILSGKMDDIFNTDQTPNTTSTEINSTEDNTQPTEDSKPTQDNIQKTIVDVPTVLRMAQAIRADVDALIRMLSNSNPILNIEVKQGETPTTIHTQETGEKVLEGVFNGYAFIGEDGKEYAVPPNYASKSKLIEGDMMKLTITRTGSFIYKQIGPTKRKTIIGELTYNADKREWLVFSNGRTYKILTASATFHRGRSGDKATLVVPESGESNWGAIDNIIHTPHIQE